MKIRFDTITIFPDFFRGPLDYGIIRRAREAGLVEFVLQDLRAFTRDRHKTVDDRPFGGGEGMVLKPEPLFESVEALGVAEKSKRDLGRESVVLLSATGRRFDQACAQEFSALERIVLICGRYEGVDERVNDFLADRELSIGDFVLSGGEIAAALVMDAVTRLIPGALGNEASSQQESFSHSGLTSAVGANGRAVPASTCGSGGLLDYPHYTRPAEFRGRQVPDVLSSGNHDEIRRWRRRKALEKTMKNRPDLLQGLELSKEDREILAEISKSLR